MARMQAGAETSRLRKDAISGLGAAVLAMAFMGPATSVFFNTSLAAAGAGYALPFSILLALIVCALIASAITEFAKKISSAGFAYTFNTHGFGKQGGFISGWLLALSYAMVGPMLFAGIGAFSSDFVTRQFGFTVPWWIFSAVFVAIIWGIAASGINRSAQTALIFLVLEVGVMAALFVTIVGVGGAQGISLAPFNPANSLNGVSGLGIGMLWGILYFIGFESAATLGEETQNAHRSIPIALFAAVGVIGIYYVFSGYTAAIGFGQDSVGKFVGDDTPWATLTERYWGQGFLWIIELTVLNSIFANLLTGCNAAVRVIFAMGREGFFPRALGRVSSGKPLVALSAYMIFSLVLAVVGGALIEPFGIYGFCGTILGLGLVIIYILVNLALMRFYRREHPEEFSIVRHAILPLIASVLLLLPIYGLVYPVPAFPNNLVPYIVVGWIALGFVYLAIISRRRPEILDAMGRVWGDEPT
jgi:amino acid transporter